MNVLLSIHDVNPIFQQELNIINESLEELTRAYLVTPCWYGKHHLNEAFMKQLVGEEVILHGMTHQGKKDTLSKLLYGGQSISREFLNLPKEETKSRMESGLQILLGYGCQVKGFIPPMWYHNPYSIQAAQELGFKFTERYSSIINLIGHNKFHGIPMSFDYGENRFLSQCSLRLSKMRVRLLKSGLIRLAIHPNDIKTGVFKEILNILNKLKMKGCKFCTYGEILNI